ncbi:MAG: hypothetical protein HFE77_03175 [Clostridiales bacterium]|nr:hypothetical protein [Clostridiales bacterium]
MKIGDKVIMNNRYHVSEANIGKIWTVKSEPFYGDGVCNVTLEGYGKYAVEGLDIVYTESMEGGKALIGVKPKYVHDRERFADLGEAIIRYAQAGRYINLEWVMEYNQLAKSIKHRRKNNE